MYAIMKIEVMCDGERTEWVEGIYPTRYKAKQAMRKLYRFLAEKHRPEPCFDEENSIITLPSSAEELEKEGVSYWIWESVIWVVLGEEI